MITGDTPGESPVIIGIVDGGRRHAAGHVLDPEGECGNSRCAPAAGVRKLAAQAAEAGRPTAVDQLSYGAGVGHDPRTPLARIQAAVARPSAS